MAAAGYSLLESIVAPALQTVTLRDEEYGSYSGLSRFIERGFSFGMTLDLVSSIASTPSSWPLGSIKMYLKDVDFIPEFSTTHHLI